MLGGFASPNNSTAIAVGQCVVDVGQNTWMPFSQAIAAGYTPGYQIGVAMLPALPGNPIRVAVDDAIPWSTWNLGSGTAGPIYAGNTPSRSGSTQIGICDVSGAIIIQPAVTVTVITPTILTLGPRVSANAPFTSTYAALPSGVTGTISVQNGSKNFTFSSGATGAGPGDLLLGGSLTGINEIATLVGTNGTFVLAYGGTTAGSATCTRITSSASLFSTSLTMANPTTTWVANVQGYITLSNNVSSIRAGNIYISGSPQSQAIPWSLAASQAFLTIPINQDVPEANSSTGGSSKYNPTVLVYCTSSGAGGTDVSVPNNASFVSVSQVVQ